MTAPAAVVKLGGSFFASALLRPWLRAIEAAAGRVVLVPGGGPFADAVRAAQPAMGFDDRAADAMAKLAMAQYGFALASLAERLVVADSFGAIARAITAGRVPVWTPAPDAAADVPQSWEVTSDSLALWLARRLGVGRVLLVKQRRSRDPGLFDVAFPAFLAAYAGEVLVAGPEDLPEKLDPARLPGLRIAPG